MTTLGTLIFIATCLGLFGATLALLYTLLTRRLREAWKIGKGILIALLLYSVGLFAVSFSSPRPLLERGQEHCFAEMCFSVKEVTTTKKLGAQTAHGIYYVLTVQLRNSGRRQPQRPSNTRMWIRDQQGQTYTEVLAASESQAQVLGQPLPTSPLWDRKLQPGETAARQVAFDLPANVVQPNLIIVEGEGWPTFIIIGDENSFFHPQTEFRLTPIRQDITGP